MKQDPLQRLLAKVNQDGPLILATACWQWTAHVHKRTGYGRFYLNGKVIEAHTASYILHVGPIPEGLELDHLCRNRACIRPSHLEPVPHSTNTRRSPVAGENVRAVQQAKDRCPKGHRYDGENLVCEVNRSGNSARRCRACRNEQAREYRRRLRTARSEEPLP